MWTICNSLLHLQKFGVNNEPFLNTQYNKTSRVICNSLDKLVFLDHFLSNLYSYFTDPFPRVEFHFSFFRFLIFFFTRFFFLFNFWYSNTGLVSVKRTKWFGYQFFRLLFDVCYHNIVLLLAIRGRITLCWFSFSLKGWIFLNKQIEYCNQQHSKVRRHV